MGVNADLSSARTAGEAGDVPATWLITLLSPSPSRSDGEGVTRQRRDGSEVWQW